MPLEAPLAPVDERAAELNARYAHHAAPDILAHALDDPSALGRGQFVGDESAFFARTSLYYAPSSVCNINIFSGLTRFSLPFLHIIQPHSFPYKFSDTCTSSM